MSHTKLTGDRNVCHRRSELEFIANAIINVKEMTRKPVINVALTA
jgi:hypothetical protein